MWYVGVDLDGHLTESLDFFVDIEFQSVDWAVKAFAIEHKAGINFMLSENVRIWMGYKAAFGNYTAPTAFFISPMADLVFGFRKPKFGRQKGLFKDKMF
jgi:hypothetical protein